jgi:hypothetical protein
LESGQQPEGEETERVATQKTPDHVYIPRHQIYGGLQHAVAREALSGSKVENDPSKKIR